MPRRPARSTLFPYTTLFRSQQQRRVPVISPAAPIPLPKAPPTVPPKHTKEKAKADSSSPDRKSTRLNSSHANISYAVFCLKKKNTHQHRRLHKQHPDPAPHL